MVKYILKKLHGISPVSLSTIRHFLPIRNRYFYLKIFFSSALFFLFLACPAPAPAKEGGGRALALYKEVRCLVCQNQSIDTSDAPIARAMRIFIDEQIKEGASDKLILEKIEEKYGSAIRMHTQLKPSTWLLWLAPFGFFMCLSLVFLYTF